MRKKTSMLNSMMKNSLKEYQKKNIDLIAR